MRHRLPQSRLHFLNEVLDCLRRPGPEDETMAMILKARKSSRVLELGENLIRCHALKIARKKLLFLLSVAI